MRLENQLKLLSSTYCDRNPSAVVQKAALLCISQDRGICLPQEHKICPLPYSSDEQL